MKRSYSALLFLLFILAGVVCPSPKLEDLVAVRKAVAPKAYPPLASAAMIKGTVKIEVKIDSEGSVTAAKILEGHKLLHDVSKDAALRWKFARSTEGKERTATLMVTFVHWTERKEEERGTTSFIPPYEIELVGGTPLLQKESIP